MAEVRDKFFIKVDENDIYSPTGTFKSLKGIHTHNGVTFPKQPLDKLLHPVLKEMGTEPNGYKQTYSQDATAFVNNDDGINMLFDTLADAVTPTVENRLFKAGVNYNLMHPYMVAVLDNFSTNKTKTVLADGTYTLNKYGSTTNSILPNAGIIELQGGGGGSGGTNNSGDDSSGGGGGGGAFAIIYYRIKNTNAEVTITTKTGVGGAAGGAGSGNGGDGGATTINFKINGSAVRTLACSGGSGGTTGNYNYTPGGQGGAVTTYETSITGMKFVASGGTGGDDGVTPTAGSSQTTSTLPTYHSSKILVDNENLFVYLLECRGGSGGGRGDDTGGSAAGQAGASTTAFTVTLPATNGIVNQILDYPVKAGGTKGAASASTNAGGGGASVLSPGANGAAGSTVGVAGTLGAGAGGAGVGGNANRAGAAGGAGVIYIYN